VTPAKKLWLAATIATAITRRGLCSISLFGVQNVTCELLRSSRIDVFEGGTITNIAYLNCDSTAILRRKEMLAVIPLEIQMQDRPAQKWNEHPHFDRNDDSTFCEEICVAQPSLDLQCRVFDDVCLRL
jgi:hypothetical protein